MRLIRGRILTEIEDRARVQTDREAGAMRTVIDTVRMAEETTEVEGIVQTGAIEAQTDSQDRRLEKGTDSLYLSSGKK